MPENTSSEKEQQPMLDTRETRGDMTSREAAAVLGGVIEGLVAVFGADSTRRVVSHWARNEPGWEIKQRMRGGEYLINDQLLVMRAVSVVKKNLKGDIDRRCEHILGCAISGLCLKVATIEAVRTAVRWWDERAETFWDFADKLEGPYCESEAE